MPIEKKATTPYIIKIYSSKAIINGTEYSFNPNTAITITKKHTHFPKLTIQTTEKEKISFRMVKNKDYHAFLLNLKTKIL